MAKKCKYNYIGYFEVPGLGQTNLLRLVFPSPTARLTFVIQNKHLSLVREGKTWRDIFPSTD